MDIPLDICAALIEFDKQYSEKLLGSNWRRYLFDSLEKYKSDRGDKSKEGLKADFEEKILTAFDDIGYLRDRQNFVPHLTLGRIKDLCEKQYFQKVVQAIEQKTYIHQEVNEVILFQSILRPEGAVYKVVKKWTL